MIIGEGRVPGHHARSLACIGNASFPICRREGNHAFGPRQNLLWVHPLVSVALKVRHLPVLPICQPLLELWRARRWRRSCKPAIVEPQFAGAALDGGFHRCADLARLNWCSTCCATSLTDRASVFNSASACL